MNIILISLTLSKIDFDIYIPGTIWLSSYGIIKLR